MILFPSNLPFERMCWNDSLWWHKSPLNAWSLWAASGSGCLVYAPLAILVGLTTVKLGCLVCDSHWICDPSVRSHTHTSEATGNLLWSFAGSCAGSSLTDTEGFFCFLWHPCNSQHLHILKNSVCGRQTGQELRGITVHNCVVVFRKRLMAAGEVG